MLVVKVMKFNIILEKAQTPKPMYSKEFSLKMIRGI